MESPTCCQSLNIFLNQQDFFLGLKGEINQNFDLVPISPFCSLAILWEYKPFCEKLGLFLEKGQKHSFMANSPPHTVIGSLAKMQHNVVGSQSTKAEI